VQSEPRPAPATAAERQSDASAAELSSLEAQRSQLEQQYADIYAKFKPKQDQLRAYDSVIDKTDALIAQAEPGSDNLAQLIAIKRQALDSQRELLAAANSEVQQLTAIKTEAESISAKIQTIKSNSGNTQ
jgi:chromosome segregation ATPase